MSEQQTDPGRQHPDYDFAVNFWTGVARDGITGASLVEGPPAVIEGSLMRHYGRSALVAEGISGAARRTVEQQSIQLHPDPDAEIPSHLLLEYHE